MPNTTPASPDDSAEDAPRAVRLAHKIPDVAVMLDVGVRTVQRMIACGQLKTIRIAGRTVRVTDESIRALFTPDSDDASR